MGKWFKMVASSLKVVRGACKSPPSLINYPRQPTNSKLKGHAPKRRDFEPWNEL
jgi:hypothetical protein